MACVGAIALHITQSSQIHQPCSRVLNYNQLPACPGETEPFKYHAVEQSLHAVADAGLHDKFPKHPQQKQPGKLSALTLPRII